MPEPRTFGFPVLRRGAFVLSYLVFKTVLFWRDVRRPRLRLFAYEVVYSLCRVTERPPPPLRRLRLDSVSTVFGTFHIRPGTTDAACVSPAFERLDLDHLLVRMRELLVSGRSVLFLDIGADVGTYAVSVANQLRDVGDLRVLAFEPSRASHRLLAMNVTDNLVDDVVSIRRLALGDGSTTSAVLRCDAHEPGGSGFHHALVPGGDTEEVRVSTVDAELDLDALPDVLVLKLDVEGSEIAVLNGARRTLATAPEVLLLVEDFVDTSVVQHLERSGWSFRTKRTPYNSFWVRTCDQGSRSHSRR